MELITFSQYFERRDLKELDNVEPIWYTEEDWPKVVKMVHITPIIDQETMQQEVSVAFDNGTGKVFQLNDELYLKRDNYELVPE